MCGGAGLLYYSTCSVLGEENDAIVLEFLSGHREFELCAAESPLDHVRTKCGIQFLPDTAYGAGFYIAKNEAAMKQVLQDKTQAELAEVVARAGEKILPRAAARRRPDARKTHFGDPRFRRPARPPSRRIRGRTRPHRTGVHRKDGTQKFLFALADGNLIEGVLMKYSTATPSASPRRWGAAWDASSALPPWAASCATLRQGRSSDRSSSSTACWAAASKTSAPSPMSCSWAAANPSITTTTSVRFLRNVTDGDGIGISARNISLSTCGLADRMRTFAEEGIPLNLTVSLHAVTDAERAVPCPSRTHFPSPKSSTPAPFISEAPPQGVGISLNTASSQEKTPISSMRTRWHSSCAGVRAMSISFA